MTPNQKLAMLKKQKTRLEILLTNALITLEEKGFGGKSFAERELGMREKEYLYLMGDNNETE